MFFTCQLYAILVSDRLQTSIRRKSKILRKLGLILQYNTSQITTMYERKLFSSRMQVPAILSYVLFFPRTTTVSPEGILPPVICVLYFVYVPVPLANVSRCALSDNLLFDY